MKFYFRLVGIMLLVSLLIISFSGCVTEDNNPGANSDTSTGSGNTYEWQKYLDDVKYTETNINGETFEIFAYYSGGNAVINIKNEDGSKQQYYVDSKVLYDLKDYNDSIQFNDWKNIGPDTPEKNKETQITLSFRIGGKSYDCSTNHMPIDDGIEKLHKLRQKIMDYTSDESEIKSFTVTIAGKEYNTISGTGNISGVGAIIDFGEDKWWEIQNYVGHYEITEASIKVAESENISIDEVTIAYADIDEDGNIHIVSDDVDKTGSLDDERGYSVDASALNGSLTFDFIKDENFIHFYMAREPVPGTFPGINVVLEKVD